MNWNGYIAVAFPFESAHSTFKCSQKTLPLAFGAAIIHFRWIGAVKSGQSVLCELQVYCPCGMFLAVAVALAQRQKIRHLMGTAETGGGAVTRSQSQPL